MRVNRMRRGQREAASRSSADHPPGLHTARATGSRSTDSRQLPSWGRPSGHGQPAVGTAITHMAPPGKAVLFPTGPSAAASTSARSPNRGRRKATQRARRCSPPRHKTATQPRMCTDCPHPKVPHPTAPCLALRNVAPVGSRGNRLAAPICNGQRETSTLPWRGRVGLMAQHETRQRPGMGRPVPPVRHFRAATQNSSRY
jgi:hypothetical protein